jgi:hypothetical protein
MQTLRNLLLWVLTLALFATVGALFALVAGLPGS